ncbi:KR domain [Trypanosoma vivax]|nr:3-oxoacyl-(acyl-carrier protein) reductase [Trypanosoma vivax]KAH8615915.1 KR domain [Trypanosoma vivax]
MPWDLRGRVGVITGASSAIGKQVATRLIKEHGMRLACVSRGQLDGLFPPECCLLKGDISNSADCDAVAKSVRELFGPVALLVNCAGVTSSKLHVYCTENDYDAIMDVNLRGALQVTRSILRHGGMLQGGDGCVVHIGSLVGCMGNSGQVLYSASKAALSGAVKSWAREYGRNNLRFNVVAPALIEGTGMCTELHEKQRAEWQQRCPLGRLGTVEDVADAVIGIARCRFISGQTINVDGGMW